MTACYACPNGTYTFTADSSSGATVYTTVWGATAEAQCILQPSAPTQLVCMPGTYMLSAGCVQCPLGYYCPQMTTTVGTGLLACPNGMRSTSTGALASADCTMSGPVTVTPFEYCAIAPTASLPASFVGLSIETVTFPLASSSSAIFATSSSVYRFVLDTLKIQYLAGDKDAPGNVQGLYTDARFTSITALAADADQPEAKVIVIGDAGAHTVTYLDLFTNKVTLLGVEGAVHTPGGIDLRRDATTQSRVAYVTDTHNNRILSFDLDTLNMMVVAGSISGQQGSADGFFSQNYFRSPMGAAFIERNLATNRILLVADSGNSRIRALDTSDMSVSTWFAPFNGELVTPTTLSIVRDASGDVMVYVVDTGFSPARVAVIAYAVLSDPSVKILTVLSATSSGGALNIKAIIPEATIYSSSFSVAQQQLLYLDSVTKTLGSLLEPSLAASNQAGGVCVFPCGDGVCNVTTASLCGNFFIDDQELCDDGDSPTGGCDDNCMIITTPTFPADAPSTGTAWACPSDATTCLSPCPAFYYSGDSKWHCSDECLHITPPTGYTIDAQCQLVDIDECAEGTSTCNIYGVCKNEPGTYSCACLDGYYGDGSTCARTSYVVYTAIELPNVPREAFWGNSYAGQLISHALAAAYAAEITSMGQPMGAFTPYTLSTSAMAALYSKATVNPDSTGTTRLKLETHFPDLATATAASTAVSRATLQTALSNAISGADGAVTVLQGFTTQLFEADGFGAAQVNQPWGMNITAVSFNRSCTANGQSPSAGCWQLELTYIGGGNLGSQNFSSEALNVLYIPRIENAPITNSPKYPTQTLTMQSASLFPCATTAGGQIGRGATACCLRDVLSTYRPSSAFRTFVDSDLYGNQVPSGVCAANGFNATYPLADVVQKAPFADGASNDMVLGPIDGMASSEVRLLERIDVTTRTYKVLVVISEEDMLANAAIVTGAANVAYTATFFVGLANFKGLASSSILQTHNMQQKITVTRSNTLTLSSYGANQDPLVNYAGMQLVRVKVTDFFAVPQYLYYLNPLFEVPVSFGSSPGTSTVPLSSIMLSKNVGGVRTSEGWMQECSSSDNTHVYANATLRNLVSRAQQQSCVGQNLAMCTPPINPTSIVQFGVPVPIGLLSDSDFTNPAGVSLQLQFTVDTLSPTTNTKVSTALSLSIQLTALGLTKVCETLSQAQTLEDIVRGDVYIGLASTNAEWNSTVLKKQNFDKAGSVPANSFQFETVTVQGSVMTFTALGDDAYFNDPRALTQGLNIYDMHTVHFLEPVGGKGGPTPNFDAVLAQFLAGNAYTMASNPTTGRAWLTPNPTLLSRCPYIPSYGKMACVTRIDSTIAGGTTLKRANSFLELNTTASSVVALQQVMADVLYQGSPNQYTRELGASFYQVLGDQLHFNNRYRKAYVLNPVLQWSYQAIQAQEPGATPYTVCTKIIAIALISFKAADGSRRFRRLLSVQDNSQWVDPLSLFKQPLPESSMSLIDGAVQQNSRHMLQLADGAANANDNALDATQATSITTTIPGFDPSSSYCRMLGVNYQTCAIAQFVERRPVDEILCAAQDTAGNSLQSSTNKQLMDTLNSKGLRTTSLISYKISGCPTSSQAARRLLDTGAAVTTSTPVMVTVTEILLISDGNGTITIHLQRIASEQQLLNTTLTGTVLGGGAYVSFAPIGGSTNVPIYDVIVRNGSVEVQLHPAPAPLPNATTRAVVMLTPSPSNQPLYNIRDVLFDSPIKASAAAARMGVTAINLALSLALMAIFSSML